MSAWFETWFEAPEYLELYKHRNNSDAAKLVKVIQNSLAGKNIQSVLDMACGAGRHSILFAKDGYTVTGVDLSENLLKSAAQNAAEANVQLTLYKSDLRALNLNRKFDLVLNVFTSFGYFEADEENFGLFKTAANHLREGGFFAFDYFNPVYLRENLVPMSINEFGPFKVEQQRKIDGNRVQKNIIITRNNHTEEYMESVSLYDIEILRTQILKNGFVIDRIYGDYSGSEFSETDSKRIVIIAQKV